MDTLWWFVCFVFPEISDIPSPDKPCFVQNLRLPGLQRRGADFIVQTCIPSHHASLHLSTSGSDGQLCSRWHPSAYGTWEPGAGSLQLQLMCQNLGWEKTNFSGMVSCLKGGDERPMTGQMTVLMQKVAVGCWCYLLCAPAQSCLWHWMALPFKTYFIWMIC